MHAAVDIIFIVKANMDLKINENEIRDYRYVTHQELNNIINNTNHSFSP